MAEAEALPEGPFPKLVGQPTISSWSPASLLSSASERAPAAATVGPAPGPALAPGPAPGPMPASVAQTKAEVLREVNHDKHPGGGYKKGSPLYEKQQALVAKTPVSMTMKCIIFLTIQFFLVYSALFITQTINRVKTTALPRLERNLVCVVKTLYFIPMLCVLFLATRMRAIQLTQGMTERYDLPQWWVKQAMLACSLAVCLQTVLAAVYYALLEKAPDAVKGGNPSNIEKALNFTRWLIIVCLYLGFMIVCIGVCTMPAPEEIWGQDGGPKVSPAVFCTIFLATLYFAIHFLIELVKTVDEMLTPEGKRFGVLAPQTLFLRDAAATVDIAPMLCILFLAARLRALQLDPKTGNPTAWAQTFFYVSSFSVLGLVLLCVVTAFLLQNEGFFTAAGQEEPRPGAQPSKKVKVAEFLRSLFMLTLFLGATVIIVATFQQKHAEGATPAMPPSIKCVMILTTLYFVVYAAMYIAVVAKKLRMPVAATQFVTNFSSFLEKRAKEAIDFCPMLCILFLGTFMRALQITSGQGAPQRWAQIYMYIGTMSVIIMTVARIDLLVFPPVVGPDGAAAGAKPSNPKIMAFFFALQHLCLLLMHVAVVGIIVALFTMTPENATGAGSMASADTI